MSNNYVLDIKPGGKVDYFMRAGKDWVRATCAFDEAVKMLYGDVRETEDVQGFPLTADGVRFFPGRVERTEEGVLD